MKFITSILVFIIIISSCRKEDSSLFNKWNLISYVKETGAVAKSGGFRLKLDLAKDKNYTVQLNTNSCFGEFTKGANEISFISSSCDSICCDSTFSKEAFALLVDSISKYEITGSSLKLKGGQFTTLHFALAE